MKRDKELLFLISLFALCLLITAVQVAATRSWSRTTGTITQSYVTTVGWQEVDYDAIVSYTYAVRDSTYDGDRIWPGFLSDAGGLSEKFFFFDDSRWRVGMEVPVYYDPANPARAVLARSFAPSDLGMIVVVAAVMLFTFLKRRRGAD